MITFSELNNQNKHEVLECGLQQEDPNFIPEYYIMTAYSGVHYKTISYKSRKILEFSEIPYDLKTMIIERCMGSTGGPYSMIKDFKDLKNELGIIDVYHVPIINVDVFDPSFVLMFYHKSSDMKPGKGTGDTIDKKILAILLNYL